MKNDALANTVDTIASECLAVRIRLLNRTITNIFDDALRPLGLKVSQLNVLVVVAKRGPVSPTEVGRVLHLEKSTLSRNTERIRQRGWIEVVAGEDGRRIQLRITAKGKRLLEKTYPLWKQAQMRAQSILGDSGAKAIRRAAARVWSVE